MTPDSTGEPGAAVPALVSTEWLAAHLHDPTVRIADVRWYLPHLGRHGRDEYTAGHIPGAVFVDLDTELANHDAPGPGRHPIPAPDAFGAAMSRAGIGPGTHVVAYDDGGGAIAARLWWLLRHFGHARVSVLDGGIAKWTAEGLPLEVDRKRYSPATFLPRTQPGGVVDKEAVRRLAADPSAVVLDARAPERYEGSTEPVDPRAGHIPGARNVPFAGNLTSCEDAPAVFLSPEALRQRYAAAGVSPGKTIVTYCGSGVTACHNILALHLAGIDGALLYEGSWSDWSSDPSLPAAVGPNP